MTLDKTEELEHKRSMQLQKH